MLLQEEQHIVHWLTEYGALTKTQVIRMLKDKPPQTAEKIIRGLKRDVLLYDISGGYYLGVDPMCQPDPRMILAVWVLLQFIDKVEPMAHYPATYPSQIFFLKEDIGYLMPDDAPRRCAHYYCSAAGEVDCTEVYVVPASRFPEWLAAAQADDLKEEMLYETSEIWD